MSKRYQAGILTASYNGLKVPNAPTIGTATAGAGSASVTFTAPSDVGGGAITSYTVISSPGSITGTGSSSPVTVSGLTNGAAYTFTVVATNAYGTGPASAASNSVTPSLNYIEDVFSTYLYAGNGSTQTITNGINLSTNGGLVWIKNRTIDADNVLYDTARGMQYWVSSNRTLQQIDGSGSGYYLTANSTGFGLVGNPATSNESGSNYASWTFRKQPKFFDIVTYTGDGATNRSIAHSINGTVGAVFIKRTNGSSNWASACSDSSGNARFLMLNRTEAASATVSSGWFSNTTFKVGTSDWPSGLGAYGFDTNGTGDTYVAYIFASNAGGFGLTGSDNVILCGSFTTNGSGAATVSLGYEPQMLIVKRTDAAEDWFMVDNMRGWFASPSVDTATLKPNTSGAEFTWGAVFAPSATGFTYNYNPSSTYIYIAIRRGPMKVPTSGTSVFSPYVTTSITLAQAGSNGGGGATSTFSANFPVDFVIEKDKSAVDDWYSGPRLTGTNYLLTNSTAAQATSAGFFWDSNKAMGYYNSSYGLYEFRRAPSFFDVVCYTGTSVANTQVTHNLGVQPELIIVKARTAAVNWEVLHTPTSYRVNLNTTGAGSTPPPAIVFGNDTTYVAPTASYFVLGTNGTVNSSANTYVAYLFATCAGVSKVGSYTGTGTTLQVNCGFTGGARFVLIKRVGTTGDWYVWDSARGIVAGNDPYLLLNSTAAEVTNTDYVDTYSAGFEISSTAPAAINANGGTYIYLAIA